MAPSYSMLEAHSTRYTRDICTRGSTHQNTKKTAKILNTEEEKIHKLYYTAGSSRTGTRADSRIVSRPLDDLSHCYLGFCDDDLSTQITAILGKLGPGRLGPSSDFMRQIGPQNFFAANWARNFFGGELGPGKSGPNKLGPKFDFVRFKINLSSKGSRHLKKK